MVSLFYRTIDTWKRSQITQIRFSNMLIKNMSRNKCHTFIKIITIIIIIIIMFRRTTNAGMVEEDEHLIPAKYHRGQCTIYNLQQSSLTTGLHVVELFQTSRRGRKVGISGALKPVLWARCARQHCQQSSQEKENL